MKTKLIVVLFMLCCTVRPDGLVIIVHGTFSPGARWSMPGGNFYDEVAAQANALGYHTIPYNWSGENTIEARLRAAHGFASLLLSYPPNKTLIAVGHSHGGTVIGLATELLALARDTKNKRTASIQAMTHRFIKIKGPWAHYPHYEKPSYIEKLLEKIVDDLEAQTNDLRVVWSSTTPRLQTVFFLGTPISKAWLKPDFTIIGKLISLYSVGDYVQSLVGERTFASQPQIRNLRLTLDKKNPSHEELHAPLVGRWLLSLDSDKILCDGVLALEQNQTPLFMPMLKKVLSKLKYLAVKKQSILRPTHSLLRQEP